MNTIQQEITDLLARSYTLRVKNLMSAIALTEEALAKSSKIEWNKGVAKSQNQLALFSLIQGEFDTAMRHAESSLNYFESTNDKEGIATARYNIGSILYRTDNYHQALHYLLESLDAYKALNDYHNQARVLKSMGTIYEYFNDYDNAANAYIKCIEASREVGDLNSESNAYNPLSGLFLKRGDTEQAMITIENSIRIKHQTNDRRGLAFALYGRGKVYLKKAEFNHALQDLNESLTIQLEAGDKLGTGMVYIKLGQTHIQLKQYERASDYLLKALTLAEKFNLRFIRFKAYYNLYTIAKLKDNRECALEYLEKYMSFKESVINAETTNIIRSYETLSKIQTLEQEARSEKEKTNIIEEKNKELDSFFYRVSHDLKGPISSLIGLHQIIKTDVQDETALSYFNMYYRQIQRINNIVLSLIDITRMKHIEVQKQRIDFEGLVEECIQSYTFLENFNTIKFIKEIQPDIEFLSEWAIVNTILQNLIENAIKYSRKGVEPFVRIVIYRQDDNVIMVVEDNGQGIPAQHQTKIFDMFHRANDRVQGSGLGLYILKRATERLKGTIELISELNLGSKFVVNLPIA